VAIDGRLTTSDHVTALCRSGYYQLRQLRPVARAPFEAAAGYKRLSPGVYILSARLRQRAALRYHGQLVPVSAVDPERGGATSDGHQATRPHLTSSVTFALAASEATGRLQTSYIGLQVAARRNPLSLTPRTPLSALGRRQRSHCSANFHSAQRGVFRWRDLKYVTVFPPHCENLTLNLCSSNDF